MGTVTLKEEIPFVVEIKFAFCGPLDPEKLTVATVVDSGKINVTTSPGNPALIERSVVGSIIGMVLVSVVVPAACAVDPSAIGKMPEKKERQRAEMRIFERLARKPIMPLLQRP